MNEKKVIKLDGMLLATFLSMLFYSVSYPFIYREIMQVASSTIIAVKQIIDCLGVVLIGGLWNRNSETLFRFYPVYCVVETVFGICLTIYAIISENIITYYLLDAILFAAITRNIVCGGTKMRAIRYATEKQRERFDNNDRSATAIATIIGSVIAMKLNLSFPIMLGVATFGNAIDNVFCIFIYFSTKRR